MSQPNVNEHEPQTILKANIKVKKKQLQVTSGGNYEVIQNARSRKNILHYANNLWIEQLQGEGEAYLE